MEKYKDKNWLEEQYIKNKRSTTDMARECDVSYKTISRWLHRFGIPVRSDGGVPLGEKRERARAAVRDFIERHGETIYGVSDRPSLNWNGGEIDGDS